VELARQVDIAIEALDSHALLNNTPNTGPNPPALAKLRSAISQSLLDQLAVVDFLADQARDTCEIDLAEVAYTRMLHIYQGHPFPDSSRICALLDKMASFYSDLGDPVRVHSCCRDIIKLRDSPDQIHGIERRAWDRLAECLPHQLEIVSNVFRSQVMDNLPSMDIGTPFQISEGMLNSVHNSGQAGVPSQAVPSVNRTGSYNMGNAVESAANLVETIQRLPNLELETRDQCKRTPLFLAAFLKQEDAGHSLLRRIASCSEEMSLSHLNVKDVLGQTVLGAAVSSGCSIIFIRALVESGAEVNPDLEARSHTPFQVACMRGNVEVASFLLERGADINRNYPDSPHPIELARTKGHTQILQLIHKKTKPSLQQNPSYFSEPQDQNGDDIVSTVVGNPSPSSSTRNSGISMFSAQNTTSPTLSPYIPGHSYFDEYLNNDGME
jgi:Ankyrin repeats (3 copies)